MQAPNRNGRGVNNVPSMNGGFPAFPDPFAGFGGFGGLGGFGGRPGSLLTNMFENDPFFSDPFFSRTFGAPFGAGGIFGPSGIFNSDIFGVGQHQGHGEFLEQRPYTSPAEGNRRNIQIEGSRRGGVKIEELPDDHDIVGAGQSNSNEEPIVEHPEDDDEKTETFRYQPRSDQLASSRSQSRRQTQSAYNPVRTYSFQSSSVVYGGSNGQYYSSQTRRRQGPDGVIEEEHQEKDTTSGMESHRLSHGLHERGRSMTRKRNAEGREEKLETLHNLEEDEVQDFERTWETMAEKSLPKWNKSSSSQRLGSSSKSYPALPSSRSNRR
ncbi:unnamed protein product [Calypogeia fissa]